jgi:threonyl-tRNA synthetase
MAKAKLPDGSILEVADGATVADLAAQIGPGLARVALAAKINDQLMDLSTPLIGEVDVVIITAKDDIGLEITRHSCAHIMAEAICSIWPKTQLVYGPTVTDGFYYDIDLDTPIRPEDFKKIEQKMKEIVTEDTPFERIEMNRDDAVLKMAGEKYKLDNIEHATGDVISFYRHGSGVFEDLCRGPHISRTGSIDAGETRKNWPITCSGWKKRKNEIIDSSASRWTCSAFTKRVPALRFCIPRA